jgi:hypothetical protein
MTRKTKKKMRLVDHKASFTFICQRNNKSFKFFCPPLYLHTGCPKNGVLTVHYGVEEITVNARKMLKKFYWTYLLIWRFLKVSLNRSIILKYMYEIVIAATSHRTYYHKVQDHSLPISNPA